MMRSSVVRAARPAVGRHCVLAIQRRSLVSSPARMAAGDTGAPRSGGEMSGDSFNKREKANEDFFVKQKEKEKLLALKDKIAAQQKHLKELDEHIDELTKDQGYKK